jgi:dihydrofolate synthase/folylpolyglutamate synthase
MMRFSSSSAVFRWIEGFINHERGTGAFRDFRLERMEILAGLAGHPERGPAVIHVAGSKGKGSVTGMIAAILEAGGISAALYASPHVSDYRERVRGGRSFFGEEVYTAAGEELAALTEALGELPAAERERFSGGREGNSLPTFFELMTLYFFLCARRAGAGALAVETGLGGRLDATNIVEPRAAVITLIEKEHTGILGDSLEAIAAEKAGIVKPGRPLILAAQDQAALGVFRERAAACAAPLHYFPEEGRLENIRLEPGRTVFNLRLFPPEGEKRIFRDLEIPLAGEIQAHNAGLAVAAVLTVFPFLSERAIRGGLRGFSLPGRFERLPAEPPYVIDGAHTPSSVEAVVKTFTAFYGEGGILLFGCASDKDAALMADLLAPRFSSVIITAPGTFRTSDPPGVFETFRRAMEKAGVRGELLLIPGTGEAIGKSRELSRKQGLPALGIGSFYLAGELRAAFGLGGNAG